MGLEGRAPLTSARQEEPIGSVGWNSSVGSISALPDKIRSPGVKLGPAGSCLLLNRPINKKVSNPAVTINPGNAEDCSVRVVNDKVSKFHIRVSSAHFAPPVVVTRASTGWVSSRRYGNPARPPITTIAANNPKIPATVDDRICGWVNIKKTASAKPKFTTPHQPRKVE